MYIHNFIFFKKIFIVQQLLFNSNVNFEKKNTKLVLKK